MAWAGIDDEITDEIDLITSVNADHPLDLGRVGWWLALPGLDGGRRWMDLVGQNHGVLTAMTRPSGGWKGTARQGGFGEVLFDGVGGYVSVPSSSALGFGNTQDLTIQFWLRLAVTGVVMRLITKAPAGFIAGYTVDYDGTTLRFFTGSGAGGQVLTTANTALATAWTHCAVVVKRTTDIRFYINGLLDATRAFPTTVYSFTNSAALEFGQIATNTTAWLQGSLDDVSISSRALTAAQIQLSYAQGRAGYPGVLNRVGPDGRKILSQLLAKSLAETLILADGRSGALGKAISEALALTDSRTGALAKVLTQALGLTDSQDLALHLALRILTAAGLADGLTVDGGLA